MIKGKFITIEGCEGTGKSTQIKLLEKNLKKKIKIKSTREPGGSFGAEQIRKLIFIFSYFCIPDFLFLTLLRNFFTSISKIIVKSA